MIVASQPRLIVPAHLTMLAGGGAGERREGVGRVVSLASPPQPGQGHPTIITSRPGKQVVTSQTPVLLQPANK